MKSLERRTIAIYKYWHSVKHIILFTFNIDKVMNNNVLFHSLYVHTQQLQQGPGAMTTSLHAGGVVSVSPTAGSVTDRQTVTMVLMKLCRITVVSF